ncbi:beige/beach domain containing protein, partial [Entamoeba invadens IP1]
NMVECDWVTPKAFEYVKNFQGPIVIPIIFEITDKEVVVTPNFPLETSEKYLQLFRYELKDIKEVLMKRYVTVFNGLEIYFPNHSEYFVFQNELVAKRVYFRLLLSTNLLDETLEEKVNKASEKWANGKMSNFEYLMRLNELASRSYNDMSHYPIFPWVIQDYTSTHLDLNNPSIYRPLDLPIPCVNFKRHRDEMKRFDELFGECGAIKDQEKYMYSTFYSACDYVFHFLVRVEPFTSMFIKMNENHYDRPERMFYSVGHTWDICMSSTQCNIELIPEFFYLPDFLKNENLFNFGVNPVTNSQVGDVSLPPWAKSPEEFIQLNHQALESPLISATLNRWIDLIFGYKSCGEEALKADNLYHPSCYVTEQVRTAEENDVLMKRALFSGQVPVQLFKKSHIERKYQMPLIVDVCKESCLSEEFKSGEEIVSVCLEEKGMMVFTEKNTMRVPGLLSLTHKKNNIGSKKGEKKWYSYDKKYSISLICGVVRVFSDTKNYTLKCSEVSECEVIMYEEHNYLIFGCVDSLLGVVELGFETPVYLNAHVEKISCICFEESSGVLVIGDVGGVVSCYRCGTWRYLWHIALGDKWKNTIVSVVVVDQYIYVMTEGGMFSLSMKGKVVSFLDFVGRKLVKSFVPFTVCVVAKNNELCFVSTVQLSCLPIEVDMPDLSEEIVVNVFFKFNSVYMITESGRIVRIYMKMFENK